MCNKKTVQIAVLPCSPPVMQAMSLKVLKSERGETGLDHADPKKGSDLEEGIKGRIKNSSDTFTSLW
jgi:hypothetical protein